MLVLVRYGEIGVKSRTVRGKLEGRLRENLSEKLGAVDIDGRIVERDGRIFADVEEEDAADAALALSKVPGVVSVSPVATCGEATLDRIAATAVEVVEGEDGPFAVDARRAGEHDFTSVDIEEEVGAAIVEEHGLVVDLDDPAVTVHVEARYTEAYVYTEVVEGIGGLPVGEDAAVVPMEDRASTVAAYRMMRRGCTVIPVYTGREPDEVEDEIAILRQFDPAVKLTVMEGEETGDAVERACDLFDADAAAFGTTAEDLDEVPEVAAERLFPNCGDDTDAVLDTYAELMRFDV